MTQNYPLIVIDTDNNDSDDGIHGNTFSLDDVFNDTFNPKLFHAQWISGMSVCQFVCYHWYVRLLISMFQHCIYVCTQYVQYHLSW